jgi:hypothetical protein
MITKPIEATYKGDNPWLLIESNFHDYRDILVIGFTPQGN